MLRRVQTACGGPIDHRRGADYCASNEQCASGWQISSNDFLLHRGNPDDLYFRDADRCVDHPPLHGDKSAPYRTWRSTLLVFQQVRFCMPETVRLLAVNLAEAFIRGPWEAKELIARAKPALIASGRLNWLTWLSKRVLAAFPAPNPPRSEVLVRFLEQDELLNRVWWNCVQSNLPPPEVDIARLPRPAMRPACGAAMNWQVRPLVTLGEVADWLDVAAGELDWFTDRCARSTKSCEGRLCHYRYRWIAKRSGGSRLLEVPKPRLKTIQRRILDEILNQIPPHGAAHAFRRGRSIASYVEPHSNQRIVIHIDLREFFPSIRGSQVHAIFRTAGYPERVASILTRLCTTRTPSSVFTTEIADSTHDRRGKLLRSPHLPQGAPTSPALANLASFWLDCRLSGLARKIGASYTRYADDIVFSGGAELSKCAPRFRILVVAIVHHEGFEIRHRKTREMRRGAQQQVAGVILNDHPNMPRRDYDVLRAILHNCCRSGPDSQNLNNHPHFREHLLGRIAYWSSICPKRAAKLKRMFESISWS